MVGVVTRTRVPAWTGKDQFDVCAPTLWAAEARPSERTRAFRRKGVDSRRFDNSNERFACVQ